MNNSNKREFDNANYVFNECDNEQGQCDGKILGALGDVCHLFY